MIRTSHLRAMLVAAAFAAASVGLPSVVHGQRSCSSTYRELSPVTPRAELAQRHDSVDFTWPLVLDGVHCGAGGVRSLVTVGTTPAADSGGLQFRILLPTLRLDLTGGLPAVGGTGSAWAGRGANVFVRAGAAADYGRFHAVLAPELWSAENRPFDLFPSTDSTRSSFASPWYGHPYSLDVPSRMGVDRVTELALGQTAAWARTGPVDVGVSASSQHWGPGRHGGLVLGPDAPGIPRVFVRTPVPVATRVGAWSLSAFAGALAESRYFDREAANDRRSLAAVTLGWRPHIASAFSAGVAHATMRGRTVEESSVSADSRIASDQLNAVFAQLGGGGSRVYTEVARAGALPALGSFLRVPYAGVAYLVGVEHAVVHRAGTLMLAAEAANLEQPTDVRGDSTFDFYSSRRIPQGWTHRGRVLGYPSGPGSSHQEIALDWITPRWSLGVFGDHTRWNEDAFHRQYLANALRHDVSVRAGVVAGYVVGGLELSVALSAGRRLNYLFQNARFNPDYRTVDVSIPQLRIGVAPVVSRVR